MSKKEAEFEQYEKVYLEATIMDVGERKSQNGTPYPIYQVAVKGQYLTLNDRFIVKKENAE